MDANLLFLLSCKFRNKRIVRNIYEHHTATRKYWLKQYRYCINNGYIKNKCSHYTWPSRGVRTFQMAGDRLCRGKNHSKCYPGLHAHRAYPPLCWTFRIKEAEYSTHIKPQSMKFATKKSLWKNCTDNELAVPRVFTPHIDKERYIELLMLL